MFKTVLLVLFLIMITFFSGRTICLLSGMFSGKRGDFFSSFTAGSLFLICLSFASHFLTLFRDGMLASEKKLLGFTSIGVFTVCYFAFVILKVMSGKTSKEKKEKQKPARSAFVFLTIASLLSIAVSVMIAGGFRLDSYGDEILETTVSFMNGERMFSLDPLTGLPYREGVPMKHMMLCLPGLYAVLSDAFSTRPSLVVLHIMPCFWFVSGLFAFISLSGSVFRDDKDALMKRSLLVIAAVAFVFATDTVFYAQGYSVLSAMWTGNAIRCWVLIPFMLYLLFEKKYIFALMPVLCEAFICRTSFGIGFCAFIYAGYILIMLIGRRSKCSETS